MRQVRQFRQVCRTAAILLLICLPAAAQLTFSGRLTVNTVNTTVDLADPAYYDANSRCQLRGIIRITAATLVPASGKCHLRLNVSPCGCLVSLTLNQDGRVFSTQQWRAATDSDQLMRVLSQ
jgi:hypothetical protein